MLEYIEGNIDWLCGFCAENMPLIKPLKPQASFLVWLDCRALGLGHDDLVDLFVNKARLALNDGETFNPGGQGFMRMNVAVSRHILRESMERLLQAVTNLNGRFLKEPDLFTNL